MQKVSPKFDSFVDVASEQRASSSSARNNRVMTSATRRLSVTGSTLSKRLRRGSKGDYDGDVPGLADPKMAKKAIQELQTKEERPDPRFIWSMFSTTR